VVSADSPRRSNSSGCSSCSCFVSFRSGFALGFRCRRFADGPSFSSGRSAWPLRKVHFLGLVLVDLFALTDGPRRRGGQSAVCVRTVRGSMPDGPRGPCGRSAPPGQTVRQILSALSLGSIPPFLSRVSACASRNRS
jgi:hypothetical protein